MRDREDFVPATKKPHLLREGLRTALERLRPYLSVRPHPRRSLRHRGIRQVSWLRASNLLVAPSQPHGQWLSAACQGSSATFVARHSSGAAADSHRLPFSSLTGTESRTSSTKERINNIALSNRKDNQFLQSRVGEPCNRNGTPHPLTFPADCTLHGGAHVRTFPSALIGHKWHEGPTQRRHARGLSVAWRFKARAVHANWTANGLIFTGHGLCNSVGIEGPLSFSFRTHSGYEAWLAEEVSWRRIRASHRSSFDRTRQTN